MKKIFTIIISLILVLSLTACGGGSSEETTQEDNSARVSEYIDALKSVVNQDVIGYGETITDITLEDRTVVINVDMSTADTSMFELKDIAEVDYSGITDAALEITDYDDLWDSMKVDFGELGSITKTKDDIAENEAGRYFDYVSDIGWD